MSEFWTEASDLYLGDFESALLLFVASISAAEKHQFLSELQEVGASGLVDDVDSAEGFNFWNALGGRALTKQEYMIALRTLSRRP